MIQHQPVQMLQDALELTSDNLQEECQRKIFVDGLDPQQISCDIPLLITAQHKQKNQFVNIVQHSMITNA